MSDATERHPATGSNDPTGHLSQNFASNGAAKWDIADTRPNINYTKDPMLNNIRRSAAIAALAAVLASPAMAQDALPNPTRTPGALNPDVTQTTIGSTICRSGWTRTVRPSSHYTSALKRKQIRDFGYRDQAMRSYEEDHLIPLVLGGAPYNVRNLWPEPIAGSWGAWVKDDLEVALARLVCSGRMPLAEAQQAIASDWITAYKQYVTGATHVLPP